MNFKDDIKHESFGMLQISRVSVSPPTNLYGSSIKHGNTIMLRIHEGSKRRDLNRDWYSANKLLVEVEMSQTQFAEAITSLNMGSGVPVTLRYVMGESKAICPEEHKRQEIEKEFDATCKNVCNGLDELIKKAQTTLNSGSQIKKADREELLSLLWQIKNNTMSTLPFIQKSFNEQMDKTVMEGKGEIEAFFTGAIQKTGLEALQGKIKEPEMVGYDKGSQEII
jgi:hypothetical protein